jgi:hypothetical protein
MVEITLALAEHPQLGSAKAARFTENKPLAKASGNL